jgi:hypothetical protein
VPEGAKHMYDVIEELIEIGDQVTLKIWPRRNLSSPFLADVFTFRGVYLNKYLLDQGCAMRYNKDHNKGNE